MISPEISVDTVPGLRGKYPTDQPRNQKRPFLRLVHGWLSRVFGWSALLKVLPGGFVSGFGGVGLKPDVNIYKNLRKIFQRVFRGDVPKARIILSTDLKYYFSSDQGS